MRPDCNFDDTSSGIHRAVIRSTWHTARERRKWPGMFRSEPLFLLWLMLRRPKPRHGDRPCESGMPPGCALVVRYQSR